MLIDGDFAEFTVTHDAKCDCLVSVNDYIILEKEY